MWGKTRRSENGRECRQPALSSWLLWLSNTWDTPQLNEVLDPKMIFIGFDFFRMRKYINRILCLALHNVLFAQYVFLPTEQAETQGGRTWQPFFGNKNGNENFRQVHIYNFRVKCVFFERNCKFAKLTQYNMQYIPCNSALFAHETLFLTQKGTFFAQRSPKSA